MMSVLEVGSSNRGCWRTTPPVICSILLMVVFASAGGALLAGARAEGTRLRHTTAAAVGFVPPRASTASQWGMRRWGGNALFNLGGKREVDTTTAAALPARPLMLGGVSDGDNDISTRYGVFETLSVSESGMGVAAIDTAPVESPLVIEHDVSPCSAPKPGNVATITAQKGEEALPSDSRWSGDLSKWMQTLRRRMITKSDFLHLHAIFGLVYLVGGSMWLLDVLVSELIRGIPQVETSTPIPLLLLGAGLINVLSSIPMADTRRWILNGVFVSVIQLWFAWQVSGAYPSSLTVADPWIAAGGLCVLIIGIVEAEKSIESYRKAGVMQQPCPSHKKSKNVFLKKDQERGDVLQRYGALANLILNGPHLYATLVGSGWVERLAGTYPLAPVLLFHAYFALGTASSLALLAPTLYSRKLISMEGLIMMQFPMIAPVVMAVIDNTLMGAAATINPVELYLGFLH